MTEESNPIVNANENEYTDARETAGANADEGVNEGGGEAQSEDQSRTKPRRERERRPFSARLWNAFKNFAIVFSFIVNFVLILVLLLSPGPLFTTKTEMVEPLLQDLDSAFAALGDTTIETQVDIQDTMPVVFSLPLEQNTDVVLTEPVPLQVPATFLLPGGGGSIKGTVSLSLPEGQVLPVNLDMDVPVNTKIPITMQVPVRIELDEAGMGPAIEQLRAVFRPLTALIQGLPDTAAEALSGE